MLPLLLIMKSWIIYIVLIIAGTFLVVVLLHWSSLDSNANGFVRQFRPLSFRLVRVVTLPHGSFGFAGSAGRHVILQSFRDKTNLFIIKNDNGRFDTLRLAYPKAFQTRTNVYHDMSGSLVYSSNPFSQVHIKNRSDAQLQTIEGLRFDHLKGMSTSSLVVRARYYYGNELNRALAKLDVSGDTPEVKILPLPEISNGFFANDGVLSYDQKSGKIVYLYYFRGEYLCLDSNLDLCYRAKTIDTVSVAKLETDTVKGGFFSKGSNRKVVQMAPPSFVHTYLCIDGPNLFVLSRLMADNERKEAHKSSQVIDVYELATGYYRYSFYIPKYRKAKLKQFQVTGNKIHALFGTSLVSYEIINLIGPSNDASLALY